MSDSLAGYEQRYRVGRFEACAMLRRIIAGRESLSLLDGFTWDRVHVGNVRFKTASGWQFTIFNNWDGLDYMDSCRSPDGRAGDFDEWTDGYDKTHRPDGCPCVEPVYMLTEEERERLHEILAGVPE